MADEIALNIDGIDGLKRTLAEMPNRLRNKALVAALRQAGVVIRQAARKNAPVLKTATPFRTPGLVRRKISVRTSKFARQAGDVGVFVGVRPAAGARYSKGQKIRESQRGAQSKNDPYYWRFVEFGTKAHAIFPRRSKVLSFGGRAFRKVKHPGAAGVRFMTSAADALPQALDVFNAAVIPAIEKLNTPK